ncbi:hypothetical protein MA16_Dca008705 [Dendrobium catenatum]|uniref:SREBP regulating gene protein n=1 Tax=Dendrobium catenatum TaxID=906689 RepID=A0A2I0W4L3_9ASPA|nr:hypothetical protein MA16_Dca008705 [Dendrobium catenatum]
MFLITWICRKDVGLPQKLVCRNTVQGRHLLADDNGYVCTALSVYPWTYCCPETGERGCNLVSKCCNSYEYCVSCCLNPSVTEEDAVLKLKIAKPVTAGTYPSAFDFCVGRCRHNSASVVHENAYVSDFHHCYSLQTNSSRKFLRLLGLIQSRTQNANGNTQITTPVTPSTRFDVFCAESSLIERRRFLQAARLSKRSAFSPRKTRLLRTIVRIQSGPFLSIDEVVAVVLAPSILGLVYTLKQTLCFHVMVPISKPGDFAPVLDKHQEVGIAILCADAAALAYASKEKLFCMEFGRELFRL